VILLANILIALSSALKTVIQFFMFTIFLEAALSWLQMGTHSSGRNRGMVSVGYYLQMFTEPLYRIVRRRLPTQFGSIDITPLIILLFLMLLETVVAQSLLEYGTSLKYAYLRV
jgi:YggT family protein